MEKERRKLRAKKKKGGEEKKSNGCTLSFYNGYFENCRHKRSIWWKVFSKIQLDIYVYVCTGSSCMKWYLVPIADVQMLYKVGFQ